MVVYFFSGMMTSAVKVSQDGLLFIVYDLGGHESEPTWLHFGKDARVQKYIRHCSLTTLNQKAASANGFRPSSCQRRHFSLQC